MFKNDGEDSKTKHKKEYSRHTLNSINSMKNDHDTILAAEVGGESEWFDECLTKTITHE